MARLRRTDESAVEADTVEPDTVEPDPTPDPRPAGVASDLDVEAWVAAIYAYRYNGGPLPVRTYVAAPSEPVHVDAVGAVTAVERDTETGV